MPHQKLEKKHLRYYLLNLLATHSKHSAYQEIYPPLLHYLNAPLQSSKYEAVRWDYMKNRTNWANTSVIDIGANTGYFSMAAIESHANEVVAVEGNDAHAKFIRAATELMEWESRLYVENRYFEFEDVGRAYDIGICEVTPSRTAQVKVQMTGGHYERRSTRQTLDRQAQVSVGY